MASFDTQEWQGRVGKSWAAEWQRTDRSFTVLTQELLRRVEPYRFAHALDVGCGAGELSISLAKSKPHARVIGVDISPDLIEVAQRRATGIENVSFELADAACWQSNGDFAPNLLVSRHGVMFFDDPVGAFANLRDISAPGARIVFSCFREVADNPFFGAVGALVEGAVPPPDPYAPGPFAFADSSRVRSILTEAGWRDVDCARFDFRMIAGAGDDPVNDAVAFFSRIGPAARAISQMDADVRAGFREKLAGFSQAHLSDGKVGLAASTWIVSAERD